MTTRDAPGGTMLASDGAVRFCCEASDFGRGSLPRSIRHDGRLYTSPNRKLDDEGDTLWWDFRDSEGLIFRVFND